MKVIYSFLFVLLSLPVFAADIELKWNVNSSDVSIGDEFKIVVSGDIPDPVLGYGGGIVFDDSKLELVSVSMSNDWLRKPTNSPLNLIGFRYPDSISGNNIPLTELVFKAKSAGTANINFEMDENNNMHGFPSEVIGTIFRAKNTSKNISIGGALLPGDANADGKINSQDLIKIINHILGIKTANGNPDCNSDGFVNSLDTVCIINKILGK